MVSSLQVFLTEILYVFLITAMRETVSPSWFKWMRRWEDNIKLGFAETWHYFCKKFRVRGNAVCSKHRNEHFYVP